MGRSIDRRPPAGMVLGINFEHGDERDLSGLNHSVSSLNAPTITTNVDLNGTTQYVNAGDSDAFSFGDGSIDSPFSIFARIKMDDATKFRLVQKWANTGSLREWIFGTDGGDKLRATFIDDSTGGRFDRISSATFTTDEGSDISVGMSYSGAGSAAGVVLYKNGATIATTTYAAGSYNAMENTTAPLQAGHLLGDSTFANGVCYSLLVFDRVLAATEFATLHQMDYR